MLETTPKLYCKLASIILRSCIFLGAAVLVFVRPAPARDYPFYILEMGESESGYALLVDKKSQKVELYRNSSDGPRLVEQYRCTTGRNNKGTKNQEGDKKTPNGIYFFHGILEDEQLPEKYGIRAFTMDYPNDYDRLDNKTGSGIWLHGVDDETRVEISYDTEGCVVVTNNDIMELSRYIKLYETPIIDDDSVLTLDGEAFETERTAIAALTENWVTAWRNKEIDRYMDCYDESFRGSGRNKAQQRRHKARLNKLYKKIEIDLTNLGIYQYHHYAVVSFIQNYRSDQFRSVGHKRLYLARTDDGFKIFAERFRRLQ